MPAVVVVGGGRVGAGKNIEEERLEYLLAGKPLIKSFLWNSEHATWNLELGMEIV